MTDAWMQRGSERQVFVEKVKQTLYQELDDTHTYEAAQVVLCAAFTEFFAKQQDIQRRMHVSLKAEDSPLRTFLFEKVWLAVQEFARTPEEALALMADLFKWCSESIVRSAKIPLQTQEVLEPEKVFDGHGAMDEP